MLSKVGFIVAVLVIAGCYALPKPTTVDFFNQVDAESRLVGGTIAPVGSVPYMVALTNGLIVRSCFCGGSIISTRHVLTAAHCIEPVFSGNSLSSSIRGIVGTNRWNLGGVIYRFSGNITHQDYDRSVIKNDIGILVTATDIAFTNLIQPVALDYSFIDGGVVGRVAGWGRIVAGGAGSPNLLELYTVTVTGKICISEVLRNSVVLNMNAPPIDPEIEICTFHSSSRGNCNGDSGSALVAIQTNLQIGVVSWGFPCALGAPDMFVRVSSYEGWLRGIIN